MGRIPTESSSEQDRAPGFFSGEYTHVIESPCRVLLPSVWRSRMPASLYLSKEGGDFPFLVLHTDDSLGARSLSFSRADPNDHGVQHDERQFFRQLREVKVDRSGRLLISNEGKEHARLADEARLIGVRNRIEIWDPEILAARDQKGRPPWSE